MKAKIIRPDFYEGDRVVTLTASVTSGDVTKTKDIHFLVRKADRTDDQSLEEDAKYIKENIPNIIRENIQVMEESLLPAGSNVTWESSNISYIATNGQVTRPDFGLPNEDVTITATLTKGSKTKEVVISVQVACLTVEDEITQVSKKITWDLIKKANTDKARITSDLNLVTELDDVQVSWSSSNPRYIEPNGTVNRPDYEGTDVNVTLTATLSKDTKKSIVTMTGLKVLKKSATSQQRVDEFVNNKDKWIHWVTANGTNSNTGLDAIKESFLLPAENENMLLTWSVVNSSGEDTEISYFKIEYQDGIQESVLREGGKRYVATVTRPSTQQVQCRMKVTAQIEEVIGVDEQVEIAGARSEKIYDVVILGENADTMIALFDEEGKATWSAPIHEELKAIKSAR